MIMLLQKSVVIKRLTVFLSQISETQLVTSKLFVTVMNVITVTTVMLVMTVMPKILVWLPKNCLKTVLVHFY